MSIRRNKLAPAQKKGNQIMVKVIIMEIILKEVVYFTASPVPFKDQLTINMILIISLTWKSKCSMQGK
jgi:hypothetical protein